MFFYKFWSNYTTFKVAEERRKKEKEEKAARIIQNGCHNWLWKPVCKDGTLGINVRLGMKGCNIQPSKN